MNEVKILVVEDSKDNRYLMRELLRETGYEVAFAINGAEAVKMATAEIFDLILMDLQMPVMNGAEATKILREQGYGAPIVALTARTAAEDRGALLKQGFDAHLSKPVRLPNLLRTINEIVNRGSKSGDHHHHQTHQ